jgi:hypothetical protein
MNKPLEWKELWDAMDANPDAWIPTTEAMYWQMLEVLPPIKMLGENFLVGEANDHNENGEASYACFSKYCDKYVAKHMTVKEFIEWFAWVPRKEFR